MEDKKEITVGEVVKMLLKHNQNAQFLVSSDEELNSLFWGFEIAKLVDNDKPQVVIYGLSGQEEEI